MVDPGNKYINMQSKAKPRPQEISSSSTKDVHTWVCDLRFEPECEYENGEIVRLRDRAELLDSEIVCIRRNERRGDKRTERQCIYIDKDQVPYFQLTDEAALPYVENNFDLVKESDFSTVENLNITENHGAVLGDFCKGPSMSCRQCGGILTYRKSYPQAVKPKTLSTHLKRDGIMMESSDCFFEQYCQKCSLLSNRFSLDEVDLPEHHETTCPQPSAFSEQNIYENIWEIKRTSSFENTNIQYKQLDESISSNSSSEYCRTVSSSSFYSSDSSLYTCCSQFDPPPDYENLDFIQEQNKRKGIDFEYYLTPPVYENIFPRTNLGPRPWNSTPNLFAPVPPKRSPLPKYIQPLSSLCSAEEVNYTFESTEPIQKSVLLTASKLDLLSDTVTVRKNSVTSDIVMWHSTIRKTYSCEKFEQMEEKSLLWLPTDTYSSKSATSSPVQLRRQNTFLLPSSQSNPIRHTSLIELGEDSLNDSIKSSKQGSSGPLTIIKEGPIDRSKIVDSNRKPKKWVSNAYACLTTNSFYLFDKKQTFDALKSGVRDKRNYDIKIDLLSCELLTKSEFSSRKNIIAINDNKLKSQIILQFDKTEASDVWFNVLKANITRFQSSKRPQTLNSSLIPPPKIVLPANRAKEQKHIKQKLKKFFGGKRPAVGVLIKNGIYKNESVFGSDLEQLCENLPRPKVPYFVRACVEAIQPYLDTEGLYRASGNLSQIQKIRFEVDQHQYENVDGEKVDVHVLTGALKLFFRELKVSLIPAESYDQCVQQESTNSLRDILKTFPESHIDTLKFLLEHLLDVAKLERENRMDISNLATVWAPNLLQKVCKTNDTGSDQNMNLFFECSQQMKLIKFFLTNYREIFSDL